LEMKMNWWDSMYFDLVPDDKIEVQKVYSSDNFLIIIWNDKFLYFPPSSSVRIELNIPVNYVKRIGNLFLFNTDKWTFVYDNSKITNDTIEYVDIFSDFVYYNDWYVWILKSSDTRRIKNLWFNLSLNSAIVYYNPATKEKKILYETSLNLTKIYLVWSEIYFEEDWVNIYKLENY
jgi:hypothetical protein